MKQFITVIFSPYSTGKTTFANWYAQEHKGLRLDYDYFKYKSDNFDSLVDSITAVANQAKNDIVILDGWGEYPARFNELASRIDREFVLCFCLAAPAVVMERQKKKKTGSIAEELPLSIDRIRDNYYANYMLIETAPYKKIFVDTTKGFEYLDGNVLQRIMDHIFLYRLTEYEHDNKYQDIELPSGLKFDGVSQSRKTWERIKDIIDYHGKTILDIGCLQGYFSFKFEEAGAAEVTGVDRCESGIEVAKQIAQFKHSNCNFKAMNAEDLPTDKVYDIVCVLNMLQYTETEKLMDKAFSIGKVVIFEVISRYENDIRGRALIHRFDDITVMSSHRYRRMFIICRNKEHDSAVIKVNKKYTYHYGYEHTKYMALLLVSKFLRITRLRKPALKLLDILGLKF